MADVLDMYEKLMNAMFSSSGTIQVASEYHQQMAQINALLRNDTTGLISTILDFMIHSANVPYSFDAQNETLNKVINKWSKEVNKDLNIDIPKGLRNFTEQFMRERLKSSMNVIRMKWSKVDGYWLPTRMWLMDGASIYVKNEAGNLNTNTYYLGQPKKSSKLQNTANSTVLVRKPYNQWYDLYPSPYLVKRGAMYHAMFKQKLLERIAEVINTAFPYQFFIKMGTEQAINNGKAPSGPQLQEMLDKFKARKSEFNEQAFAKGLGGAFPADVKFEELIPSYDKVLNDKIMAPIDKNILSAMGMIELKGFAQNREEMILNPKVLVEEVVDCVADYTDFLECVMDEIKERNSGKYTFSNSIDVSPGVIESFITDDMRSLIRSLYDRGMISMEDMLEDTTPMKFKTQIKKRKQEKKEKLDVTMYPRVVQNLEKDPADLTPDDDKENIPDDKKPGTPEAENFKNAFDEADLIIEPMKSIRSIPKEIRSQLSKEQQQVFKIAFNEAIKLGKKLKYDNFFLEKSSMEFATKKAFEIVEKIEDK